MLPAQVRLNHVGSRPGCKTTEPPLAARIKIKNGFRGALARVREKRDDKLNLYILQQHHHLYLVVQRRRIVV